MAANPETFKRTQTIANYDLPSGDQGGTQDPTTRLANIVPSDSSEDNDRIAFMRIEGESARQMFEDLKNLWPADQGPMEELLNAFIPTSSNAGYAKMCITALQDSRAEKMQIMQTCGDNFIATFTGREPHILGVQGYLIFDFQDSNSWYHAFINAYEYYLRASRMAKYRCKMRLVFPDFQQLVGYMINLNTSHNSDSDTVIPFSFSMLVIDKTPAHALYLGDKNTTGSQTTTKSEDVKAGEEPTTTVNGVDVPQSVADAIPSQEDYDNYNSLKDRIDNGDELSEDEAQQFQDLTDKINNQGPAWASYRTAETQQLSEKEAAGTITQEEADQLMDNRERQYASLTEKRNNGTITPSELLEYQKLEQQVAPQTMYRNLQEKQSSGQELTEYEQNKLNELEQDLNNPTVLSKGTKVINTPTPDANTVVTQPESPAATAVEYAQEVKDDPAFNLPISKPDKNLSSEQTKTDISDGTATVVDGQLNAVQDSANTSYTKEVANDSAAVKIKQSALVQAFNTKSPGADYKQNYQTLEAIRNMYGVGTTLIKAYDNVFYGKTKYQNVIDSGKQYIAAWHDNYMAYQIPSTAEIWTKMQPDANGNYVPAPNTVTAVDPRLMIHNTFYSKYCTTSKAAIIKKAQGLVDFYRAGSLSSFGGLAVLTPTTRLVNNPNALKTDPAYLNNKTLIATAYNIASIVLAMYGSIQQNTVLYSGDLSTVQSLYASMETKVNNVSNYETSLHSLITSYFTYK